MSLAEAAKEEATRQVRATHKRIMTKSDPEPARRRPLESQALKASKKSSKSQPHAGGSSEGTATKPGVPDEPPVVFSPSSEGTCTKLGVPSEQKDI
nr:hypothetical protein [Tanacetum cinerariifolium]